MGILSDGMRDLKWTFLCFMIFLVRWILVSKEALSCLPTYRAGFHGFLRRMYIPPLFFPFLSLFWGYYFQVFFFMDGMHNDQKQLRYVSLSLLLG